MLGWRVWTWDGGVLRGLHFQPWATAEMTATCVRGCHPPARACRCGVHALPDGADVEAHYRPDPMGGVVLLAAGVLALVVAAIGLYGTLVERSWGLLLAALVFWTGVGAGTAAVGMGWKVARAGGQRVVGVVTMTGRALLYENGARAARARLLAVWDLDDLPDRSLDAISARYGVPVFGSSELQNLRAYVSEWGIFDWSARH